MVEIYIAGSGGFAQEVFWYIRQMEHKFVVKGFVDQPRDEKLPSEYCGVPIFNELDFDYAGRNVVVGTGYPRLREKIVNYINTHFDFVDFPNIISPAATITSTQTLRIGHGVIIASGCVVTNDVTLDGFVNLNMNTTIGHNSILCAFATTATNVSVSGNVTIGRRVHLGNNSCVKERCLVGNDIIVGMGGVVTKNLYVPGTYIGCPARKVGI